ncbi:NADH-quinone oxidoreductase chain J [Komagataeibacter oboediens DSM 11826]|uniref:NADH-quinone oxidoreductase subunit J n=1 Tax=Komagataeibacter oboediens TaxID=65958 RepID=A0A318QWA0_9PROT|nr:NADH-quinone oxidoreductase subunit J [Komagataeibacter oboediens]PYD81622.1 NADH-quinone oxidoreductase subunit J [Komagataeibacter oboediens]GBR28107.1 NADH-quinone oxidoreductase chain J [Komagataeibacter oboediens DSM 11826]
MHALALLAAGVTVTGAIMVITRRVAVHAVLYLVVTLLALSVVLVLLGASFAAMLEVIIYAGAIMVLFVFVIMMLNLGQPDSQREKEWLHPRAWLGPGILATIVCTELLYCATPLSGPVRLPLPITVHDVGLSLFSRYVLMVELVSFLLLAGLVTAFHIGRHREGGH